jgi:hypothetical protein
VTQPSDSLKLEDAIRLMMKRKAKIDLKKKKK